LLKFIHIVLLAFFLPLLSRAQVPAFTDTDLSVVKNSTKMQKGAGLLYTWSPHMNLSVKGLDEAMQRSKGGERLVVLLDPNCNQELAKKIAKEHDWNESVLRTNASRVLIKRGFRVHFPSYQFVSRGELRGPLIPGYKSAEGLAYFARYLK
jgi:hypothetical protein